MQNHPDTSSDAPVESRFFVDWVDGHRVDIEASDPAYPDGTPIDVTLGAAKACRLQLVCPAARCGQWVITCRLCGYAIALKTNGRADDPSSVRMPCRG